MFFFKDGLCILSGSLVESKSFSLDMMDCPRGGGGRGGGQSITSSEKLLGLLHTVWLISTFDIILWRGELKLMNNEDKEEKGEKRKEEGEKRKEIEESPSIWAKGQLS